MIASFVLCKLNVLRAHFALLCCCAILASCSENEPNEPSTTQSDTFDAVDASNTDSLSLPPCSHGERQDGVCPPALPQFQDWICPEGWTQTPALVDVDGGPLAIEGIAPFMRCEPPPWIEPPSDCEPGTMPLYGQATCVSHGDTCPASGQPWPIKR